MRHLLSVLMLFAASYASAEADGPDHYRVQGVAPGDTVQLRSVPAHDGAVLAGISAFADGLPNLGCTGHLSYAEWEAASEDERAEAAKKTWCRTRFAEQEGWVAGRFLTEGRAPVAPGFDCAKAQSSAEFFVCADPVLAELDLELSHVYGLARRTPGIDAERAAYLRAYQRGWVKGRDECWKAQNPHGCVAASYVLRIMELRQEFSNARAADQNVHSVGPLPYVCDTLEGVVAVGFISLANTGFATLQTIDGTSVLLQVPSASGAKYQTLGPGPQVEFFAKADTALYAPNVDTQFSCQQDETG